nr:Putative uncharacterized protein [Moritella viscosa]
MSPFFCVLIIMCPFLSDKYNYNAFGKVMLDNGSCDYWE